jgi:hypothetical protein
MSFPCFQVGAELRLQRTSQTVKESHVADGSPGRASRESGLSQSYGYSVASARMSTRETSWESQQANQGRDRCGSREGAGKAEHCGQLVLQKDSSGSTRGLGSFLFGLSACTDSTQIICCLDGWVGGGYLDKHIIYK